ncbi:ImmA/IrrE family metallo-endopeptidase [Bacillus altitudinis]|uniref:ImmA/IrrE family metallo-endopeptidase n=1 Tax=Bacillus altitudinis TaxID=293387 RepID=UPI0020413706|nr:ImmA/IrrE family metallo-endopeptidase [Bacillus altitudinis]MCM3046699.1 ImmA/IrrE family metallo-endopeptidase [Bacillus altitudinis]MEC1805123.1 ImmA/IrrE family metallo-endopeptidase [Bacillus altitudinis]
MKGLSHLEEEVKKIYTKINMLTPEAIDMELMAASLKIWLHFERRPSFVFCVNGSYSMVIDKRLNKKQQWEDFGHELCHVIKHYGNQFDMHKLFRELQEYQANSFMYHFCVPSFMLQRLNLPSLQSEAIKLIGDTFNVTYSFAAARLEMFRRKSFAFALYENTIKQIN